MYFVVKKCNHHFNISSSLVSSEIYLLEMKCKQKYNDIKITNWTSQLTFVRTQFWHARD